MDDKRRQEKVPEKKKAHVINEVRRKSAGFFHLMFWSCNVAGNILKHLLFFKGCIHQIPKLQHSRCQILKLPHL